jgi:hypothetical protein
MRARLWQRKSAGGVIRAVLAILGLGFPLFGYADSPAVPVPMVISAPRQGYYLKIVPTGFAGQRIEGTVYRVGAGEDEAVYRISGWQAGALLSSDGTKIAWSGPWTLSGVPPREALAIAFFDKGKQVARYTVADLMQDLGCSEYSTKHYQWGSAAKWALNDWSGEVEIDTYDGLAVVFDITTGAMLERRRIGRGCRR